MAKSPAAKPEPGVELKIEYLPVDSINPYSRNARTHDADQIDRLAKIIADVGFNKPLVVAEGDELLAGHGGLLAAKQLGMTTVPVVRRLGLTEDQKRSWRIADNAIAGKSRWDVELLAAEIGELESAGADLTMTGFDESDMARMRDELDAILLGRDGAEGDEPGDDGGGSDGQRPRRRPRQDNEGPEEFAFHCPMSFEQREVLYTALDIVKTEHGISSSAEALVFIVNEWKERQQ